MTWAMQAPKQGYMRSATRRSVPSDERSALACRPFLHQWAHANSMPGLRRRVRECALSTRCLLPLPSGRATECDTNCHESAHPPLSVVELCTAHGQVHEELQMLRGNIRVVCRARPGTEQSVLAFPLPGAITVFPPDRTIKEFEFNACFGPESSQVGHLLHGRGTAG